MFKRILLATDGSMASLNAARAAGSLAKRVPDSEVTVLHVMHVPSALQSLSLIDVPLDMMVRQTAEAVFDVTVEALDVPAVRVHTEVQIGDPATEVVELAGTAGFDLIVMGTRGLSPIKELLLGSVSHRVLQMAPCPVMVAR